MRLLIIRHTSVNVPRGLCYGQLDVPLSEHFEAEAELVRKRLEELLSITPSPIGIFSSPLERCKRLAHYCGYPEAVLDPRLMERNFGAWEGQMYAEIDDPNLEAWYEDWRNIAPTEGESYAQLQSRVLDFLSELRQSSLGTALLFTHSGVISAILSTAGELGDYHASYGEILDWSL